MASLPLFYFLSLALVPATLGSFSVELIDRNSPKSPLYDPSTTSFNHWRMAAEHSQERARHFANHGISTPASIVSPVVPSAGGYLMKLSLGTPPFDVHVIADTGSDLTWTDCIPYQKKEPLFDPAKSTTYSNISCPSKLCSALPEHKCGDANSCQYHYSYGDGSTFTAGQLAKENFTFTSKSGVPFSVAGTIFGCSHKREGNLGNLSGVVGLGAGELSLVSHLGSSIDNQFSYCLLPHTMVNQSSKLVFGPNDRAPSKVYKTPLIRNTERSTYYFLTLVKIIVGKKSIPVPSKSSTSTGNIIIDSGSTYTVLDRNVVDEVAKELKKVVKLPPVTDPRYVIFGTCFHTDGTDLKDLKLPEISFAFAGATVPLKSQNMFVQVVKNVVCLALKPGSRGIQVYGNMAQQDFYVGYDLRQQMLSIAPANCAQF